MVLMPRHSRSCSWMLLFRFRQVKINVGIGGQDDVARVRAIRKRLGDRVDLRVDANEAWSPDEATRPSTPYCWCG